MMIIDQEKLVDNIIVNDIVKTYPELKKLIETCSPYEIRGKILSVLDPRNDLHYDYKEFHELNLDSEDLKYLDEIAVTLRNYVRVADVEREDFGEVMTPISNVNEMLDILPKEVWSNKDLKWLDPCNGVGTFPSIVVQRLMEGLKKVIPNKNKRYRHIVENMIYVCEIQAKNMFIFHCIFDRPNIFELNTFYGSFLTDEFNEHMTNVWGVDKFDIVIGNPPYKRKLNLKFLNKVSSISNTSLFVHPSSWLIDEKNINNDFNITRNIHKDTLDKVVLFNGNPVFNIGLYIPCAITYIDNNKKRKGIDVVDKINNIKITYSSINDINKFSNVNEYKTILNKINNNYHLGLQYNKDNGNYFVNMSRIRGHVYENNNETKMYKDDFYTTITKDAIVETEKTKQVYFSFKTEIEANNFLSYLKTNFSRFCLSICKNSSDLNRIDFTKIPYLDFTQEWTDEKLYQEFNLTEEEINFINTHIPKYY
jgi:hypothetical protein